MYCFANLLLIFVKRPESGQALLWTEQADPQNLDTLLWYRIFILNLTWASSSFSWPGWISGTFFNTHRPRALAAAEVYWTGANLTINGKTIPRNSVEALPRIHDMRFVSFFIVSLLWATFPWWGVMFFFVLIYVYLVTGWSNARFELLRFNLSIVRFGTVSAMDRLHEPWILITIKEAWVKMFEVGYWKDCVCFFFLFFHCFVKLGSVLSKDDVRYCVFLSIMRSFSRM